MQQREKKRNSKLLKPRKDGSHSERPPPKNVLNWVIRPGSSDLHTSPTPNTSSSFEGDSRRSCSTSNNSVNTLSSPPLTPLHNESDSELEDWLSSVVKR